MTATKPLGTGQPPQWATDEPLGQLETVALFDGAMPTGVTVSHQGRIFVNFPKRGYAPAHPLRR